MQKQHYRIIKYPLTKEKSTFLYYKPYSTDQNLSNKYAYSQLVNQLSPYTIQVIRFDKQFDKNFIMKYFGRRVGLPIRSIYVGSFKPRQQNIRKKRPLIYFALVIYKQIDDLNKVLELNKVIQEKIERDNHYKAPLKNIALVALEEMEQEQKQEEGQFLQQGMTQKQRIMEQDGFEIVMPNNLKGGRQKRAQGVSGSVGVMDADFVQRVQEEKRNMLLNDLKEDDQKFLGMKKSFHDDDDSEQDMFIQRNNNNFGGRKKKKKRIQTFPDFYKFQTRQKEKSKLTELKQSFKQQKEKIKKITQRKN